MIIFLMVDYNYVWVGDKNKKDDLLYENRSIWISTYPC